MEQRKIISAAVATAMVPFLFVLWSHSPWWPDVLAEYTDVYYPQGPTQTFSDFSPGDRTGALFVIDGKRVRPVTGSPVYLLFQPRRHSKYIRVEIVGHADRNTMGAVIGFRHGTGPEHNTFPHAENEMQFVDEKRLLWIARLPFELMTRERIDARRIVFEAQGVSTSTPLYIESVKLVYED